MSTILPIVTVFCLFIGMCNLDFKKRANKIRYVKASIFSIKFSISELEMIVIQLLYFFFNNLYKGQLYFLIVYLHLAISLD